MTLAQALCRLSAVASNLPVVTWLLSQAKIPVYLVSSPVMSHRAGVSGYQCGAVSDQYRCSVHQTQLRLCDH